MNSALKCSRCGRLWVFWNGFDSAPVSYAQEQLVVLSEVAEKELAKGLISKGFEIYLHKELGGKPSFSTKGREFDGAYGANNSTWYEAKSGRYWEDHVQAASKGFEKFKSDIGAHARIAKGSGASFEVH